MIIDANGRPAITAKQEQQLNALQKAVMLFLERCISEALKRSTNGMLELNVSEMKSALDQLYMLGRHHEAGS